MKKRNRPWRVYYNVGEQGCVRELKGILIVYFHLLRLVLCDWFIFRSVRHLVVVVAIVHGVGFNVLLLSKELDWFGTPGSLVRLGQQHN